MKIYQVLFIVLFTLSQNEVKPQQITPHDAKLQKVFDKGFSTEGPVEANDGTIYFSDQSWENDSIREAGHIWNFNPKTGKIKIYISPSAQSNGIKKDAEGNLIIAHGADFGLRSITRTNLHTGKSEIIAGMYNGKPFNSPNDIAIDNSGRIYFTDPRYGGHEAVEQPVMGVYRIDKDKKINLIIDDLPMPNGIAISPDQKTLYVGCFDEGEASGKRTMAIYSYVLDDNGNVSSKKIFADFSPGDGPDGIAVDEKGNLYAAVRNEARPGIYVYSPAGKEIAYIPTPEIPCNIAFANKSGYLYITAGKSLYRIKVLNKGYVPNNVK